MHQPRSTIDRFRTNALICAGEGLQTAVNRPEAIQHKDSWFTKVVFVGHRDSTDRIRCIAEVRVEEFGAADPMAASEKTRQDYLRIGGAMATSADGRVPPVSLAPHSGQPAI